MLIAFLHRFFFNFLGASVRACKAIGRHIIAVESDSAIFRSLLEPLVEPIEVPPDATQKRASSCSVLDDDMPSSIVKRPRFCK